MPNYQKYYISGDFKAQCDVCGQKFKAHELRLRWDGYMVCKNDFELRHPQDLLRTVPYTNAVPWTRPENIDTESITFCTLVTINAIAGVGVAGCMVAGLDNDYAAMYENLYPPTFNPNTL